MASLEEIKEKLFNHFWQQIQRGITAGLPEWYKQKLLESAFDKENLKYTIYKDIFI